jgi:hypothetical protein
MPYKARGSNNDAWPLKRRKVREAEKAALAELERYAKKVMAAMKAGTFKPGKWEMALITRYEELERARTMPRTKKP